LNPLFFIFSDQCGLFINSYCKHPSTSSGLSNLEDFLILKRPTSQECLRRTSHKSAQQGLESVQYKT